MDDTKLKYVRLKKYNEIIIFPIILDHSTFKHLNPISAGFCYIYDNEVKCFGESVTLKIKALEDDSYYATKQIFGNDAIF